MSRWVYWVSLAGIAIVIGFPAYHLLTDPQADMRDLFRLGIDLEGGTRLIYELRAPEGGEAADARVAKPVITGRIDPQGTRGYIVRAIGTHRLEIVLPGRQTKVKITPEAATRESLQAAEQAALHQQNRLTADLLQERFDAFLAGTRLVVRMQPPLYLEDIQIRIMDAVRERMPGQAAKIAVVGLEPSGDQWQEIAVFLVVPPDDAKQLTDWRDLVTTSLAAQRDVTRVKRLVRQAGFLEFRIVADKVKDREKANFEKIVRLRQAGQPPDDPQWRWYPLKKGWEWYTNPPERGGNLLDAWNFVYTVDPASKTVEALINVADGQDVTGSDLSRAWASVSDAQPVVSFEMRAEAGSRFAKLTSPENRGRQMAIILDGVIQSAPSLRATLSTGGIIEGYKNRQELEDVVNVLNSGQLAASLGDPITEQTVGPELGADNIHKGFTASLVGFSLVVIFMAAYYLFAGLVANLALVLNLVLTICIMFWIRQTWTLPGIAGLILALAMAVDANVLIYERLREEKGKEGSLGFALKKAYARAFTTIFDSNLTTVIPAVVLLLGNLATEEVKGFALVMIIGIGVSMFTAIVVTRMIFETGIRWGLIKELRMLHLFQRPNIDWMRFGRYAFVITVVISVVGIIVFLNRGEDKYDIEFVGGTGVELALKVPPGETAVPIETVRRRVDAALGQAATVQELEYANEPGETQLSRFIISVPASGGTVSGEADVKAALAKAFEDMRPEGVGEEVKADASEITEDVIRRRLQQAKVAAPAPAAAGPEAPTANYIPTEYMQYYGKIRIVAEVNPPLTLGEVRRRFDALIRDRYPDMVEKAYKIEGGTPAGAPGEFKSFEIWLNDDFSGKHAEMANPAFWTEVVQLAIGRQEAFASTTSIEKTMAGEAWDKAVIAILLSLALMAVYIWFRFAKFSSGIAAVVATVHDVLITLGAVSVAAYFVDTWLGTALALTNMKVNLPLVGAFLTLVGYSVNDTIVVFDRIRENRGKYGDLSVSVINASINQTLSRTVLTSSTVFIAVVALYFFGGKDSSIHGLAFVMLIGTVVGCYSSIAIASPILVMGDYLRKVYAWSYPILAAGLAAYFLAVWKVAGAVAGGLPEGGAGTWLDYARMVPGEFFGSPVAWVWLVAVILWLAWAAVATWAAVCGAYGRPWPLVAKAPGAAKAVAALAFLAAPAAVILGAIAALAASGSAAPAWAGPAAAGMLATCPAAYAIYRLVWGKPLRKS